MRHLKLLSLVLVILALPACNEDNTSNYSNGEPLERWRSLQSESMEMDMAVGSAMPSPVARASAPPSQMALDRSKMGNRRIAETHDMVVELEPEQLKPRYDRDFQKCLALGCEITNSNAQSRSSAYINARIAPENLAEYLDFLGSGPGQLEEHSVRADDKTLQYIDTESKIKNLEQLRARLITLLNSEKTKTINEVLQIERELNRVEQQLDSANGTLRHLSTITGKATVNSRYNVPYQDFDIKYYEFKNSFKRGYQQMLNSTSEAVRFVGGIIPWIPIWIIGLWITVKAFKFAFRKGFSLLFWKKEKTAEKKKPTKAKK